MELINHRRNVIVFRFTWRKRLNLVLAEDQST